MNTVPFTKIGVAVCGLVLLASCAGMETSVGDAGSVPSWLRKENVQACLGRIPLSATDGQRMLARKACKRDADTRIPIMVITVSERSTGHQIKKAADVTFHNQGKRIVLATDAGGALSFANSYFKDDEETTISIKAEGFVPLINVKCPCNRRIYFLAKLSAPQ